MLPYTNQTYHNWTGEFVNYALSKKKKNINKAFVLN